MRPRVNFVYYLLNCVPHARRGWGGKAAFTSARILRYQDLGGKSCRSHFALTSTLPLHQLCPFLHFVHWPRKLILNQPFILYLIYPLPPTPPTPRPTSQPLHTSDKNSLPRCCDLLLHGAVNSVAAL